MGKAGGGSGGARGRGRRPPPRRLAPKPTRRAPRSEAEAADALSSMRYLAERLLHLARNDDDEVPRAAIAAPLSTVLSCGVLSCG